jgi:hypothetical protein
MDYKYEDELYKSLATSQSVKGNERQTLINLVSYVHNLQNSRSANISKWKSNYPLKFNFLRSGDVQLLDAYGACGNYSHVLAELLNALKIPVRFLQLDSGGGEGASHILIEAKINDKWGVVDPLYNFYLINPDSSLVSVQELNTNLAYYTKQFPVGYPYALSFNKFRYTNWNKIPVLMPLLKRILTLTMGSNYANTFSIRLYFLNLHKVIFFTTFFIYIPFLVFSFYNLFLSFKKVI